MLHEENRLIDQINNGDTEQFTLLIERYAQPVHRLIVRIVGNTNDAKDITQEVFIRAYEHLSLFNHKSSFSTWLYRIAYNTAISHTRRRRQTSLPIEEGRIATVDDTQLEEFDAITIQEIQIEALTHAITKLDAEERTLITLFYYENHSIVQCSEIMSITQNTIKVRLHRIRKKLYLLLSDETE